MARVRFIGREPHTVPLLGRDIQPDEVVDVPDGLLAEYAWPETLWRIEDEPARRPAKPKPADNAAEKAGE